MPPIPCGVIYFANGDSVRHNDPFLLPMREMFNLLWQKHLDVCLPGKKVTTRIVERPAEWMTADELCRLVADLQAVACRAIPEGSLTYGVFSNTSEALSRSVITIIY